METMENVQNAVIEKSQAILRARLPHLTENGLNFEKRTGNFFKASNGVKEDGTEYIKRTVIEDVNIAEECAEEMKQKRAAAFVVGFEATAKKAADKVAEIEKELAEAKSHVDTLAEQYSEACEIVNACELPEKSARVKLADTVAKQADEIAKLRALLEAAGVNPDAE